MNYDRAPDQSAQHLFRFLLRSGIGHTLKADIDAASKSVVILSPYLNPDFLDELASRPIHVTLVTSDACFRDARVARGLVTRIVREDTRARGWRTRLIAISAPAAALALAWMGVAMYFTLQAPWLWLWSVSLLAGFGLMTALRLQLEQYEYRWRFPTQRVLSTWRRRSRDDAPYMHAKAYVIDDAIAYVGSMNFSGQGFFDHLECAVRISHRGTVQEIAAAIRGLASHAQERDVTPDRIGRWLWDGRGRWRRGGAAYGRRYR